MSPPARTTPVLLVGGLGTRIAPVLGDLPKALAPVHGRPFLAYLLDSLADAGFEKTVLATGHLASRLEETFGGEHAGMRLVHVREPEPRGTGGAVAGALEAVPDGDLLVLNGDSWCPIDYGAFARRAAALGAPAVLLATRVRDASRFGRLRVDKEGVVRAFLEKDGERSPGLIHAGCALVARSLVRSFPSRRPLSLEREIFEPLAGGGLRAIVVEEPFLDIGTPESLRVSEAVIPVEVER